MADEQKPAASTPEPGAPEPAAKPAARRPRTPKQTPAPAPAEQTADPAAADAGKPAKKRAAADKAGAQPAADNAGPAAPKNVNPIVLDETYSELRQDNRVVMRHSIALNLDTFRAAPVEFAPRPQRTFAALSAVDAPFFSVVVPNYNGERHLPTLLDALQRQTFQDFETIVVDDASPDGSAALVEQRYPAVRLLVNRQNLGFAASCNTAAAVARGRYVVLLNNDTEPAPTWLEELARVAVVSPQAAVIASKLLLFDRRSTLHNAGDALGLDGMPHNRGVWEEDRGQYDRQTAIFSGCGAASAYRKDVWEALGGFDEDFWMYLEDVDFSFRAHLAGCDVVFAPKACVYHHLSASGGDTLASYYVGRNTLWVVAKNMPRSLLVRHASAVLGAQLQVTLDALRSVRGEAARQRLRGQLDGLRGLAAQLAKRRVIQPRRQIDDIELAARLG